MAILCTTGAVSTTRTSQWHVGRQFHLPNSPRLGQWLLFRDIILLRAQEVAWLSAVYAPVCRIAAETLADHVGNWGTQTGRQKSWIRQRSALSILRQRFVFVVLFLPPPPGGPWGCFASRDGGPWGGAQTGSGLISIAKWTPQISNTGVWCGTSYPIRAG